MELATALIWTLRIVLPIILFCIYFKLQSPKDEIPGPAKNVYKRGKILARRPYIEPGKPDSLENLCLKDQSEAPDLFVTTGRRGGGGRSREDRPPRADRPDRPERGERRDRERRENKKADQADKALEGGDEVETPAATGFSTSEERMHLESVLNYVAFHPKEQQRTFLHDERSPPPPPPKKLKPNSGAGAEKVDTELVSGAMAEKANAEAQMVLQGAIIFKRADVAKNLYEQLMDSQVEITERTFTLMIEACVLACDLKSASDFLMKMETSGFCPDSELLDKVMDLYSQQKSRRELEKQGQHVAHSQLVPEAPAAAPAPAVAGEKPSASDDEGAAVAGASRAALEEEGPMEGAATGAAMPQQLEELLEGPRVKLSSGAPIFVPSFIPAPPPPPPPQANGEAEEGGQEASMSLQQQRTKLTAAAKPFEPQLNVTFDPYMYTWTVDQSAEAGGETGYQESWKESRKDGGKDRGKNGKGHGKSAGKGKWKPQEKENEYEWEDDYKPKEPEEKVKGRGKQKKEPEKEVPPKKEVKKTGVKMWKPK